MRRGRDWGLSTSYIKGSCRTVQLFLEHANEYPSTWSAHHVDEFLADRRSSEKGLAVNAEGHSTCGLRPKSTYSSITSSRRCSP